MGITSLACKNLFNINMITQFCLVIPKSQTAREECLNKPEIVNTLSSTRVFIAVEKRMTTVMKTDKAFQWVQYLLTNVTNTTTSRAAFVCVHSLVVADVATPFFSPSLRLFVILPFRQYACPSFRRPTHSTPS